MKVFDAYGLYYDLLYKDKNYRQEADYVRRLITAYRPGTKTLLELGSGTGMHACLLAEAGYSVTGVDRSATMLQMAAERRAACEENVRNRISFTPGDIRHFTNGEKYDAAISLFHVMSYMQTNNDLLETFYTADQHLPVGGLFIFDCWHGPGVLHDKPVTRKKHFSDERTEIVRVANPVMREAEHLVDVNFEIEIKNRLNGEFARLKETHTMHYLFPGEIGELCKRVHFELVRAEEWLTGKALTERSWNACYVCKKTD